MQILQLKKQIQFNSLCLHFDGMDTLERVEKIIRESALDKRKKKAWLNLTPV